MELSRFMTDNWHLASGNRLLEVGCGIRIFVIYETSVECIAERERTAHVGIVFSPCLTTDATSGELVHSIEHALVSEIHVGAEGVETSCSVTVTLLFAIFIYFPEVVDVIRHQFGASPKFVAQSHHHE